jgi:hypothetical protein
MRIVPSPVVPNTFSLSKVGRLVAYLQSQGALCSSALDLSFQPYLYYSLLALMPCAKVKNAPGLDIVFDEGTPQTLVPGSTLSGKVVLTSTEDSVSIGSVTATLYGRSKVKICQSYGQTAAVWVSRANFFNLQQHIFKSEYTYGAGSYSWPFSFEMPFVADEACLKGKRSNKFKAYPAYLSTDGVDVVEHELPPPVFHRHSTFGRDVWAFVEYVLEVTVTEAPGAHRIRGPQSKTSVRPLNFQPGRKEVILRNFRPATVSKNLTIKSLRLAIDPPHRRSFHSPPPEPALGLESQSGSHFRAALSKLPFSFASTPRLDLRCAVIYPTVIQAFHPDSLPFRLDISLGLSARAAAVSELQIPQIRITSFDLQLLCLTRCRAHTGFWGEMDVKTIKIPLAKRAPLSHVLNFNSARPEKNTKDVSTNEQPMRGIIDIGDLLPIRITSAKVGRYYEPILNPTFTSYNISRWYGLKWEIKLEVFTSQKLFREKIKGKTEIGEVTVRAIPDAIRAEYLNGLPHEMEGGDDLSEEADDDEVRPGPSTESREDFSQVSKKEREDHQNAKKDPDQLPKYEA